MKKTLLLFCIAIIGNLLSSSVMAQTTTNELSLGMPEVLLVKSNTPQIDLTLSPQEAGLAVQSSISNSSARVLISSVVAGTMTRNLSASVTGGAVPPGTYLKLIALAPNGSFVGTQGSLGAEIDLGTTAKPIITSIGTCYSGVAADDGYGLKYTFGIPVSGGTYSDIRASSGSVVTVTLTLSVGL